MRFLLDTSVFLWALFDQREKLSSPALKILRNGRNLFFLSAVSVWEIAIKHSLGKLELKRPISELLNELTQKKEIQHLSMTYEHAERIDWLPFHHKDPFDRLLIAQAQAEEIPIIASDETFRKYDVEVIW